MARQVLKQLVSLLNTPRFAAVSSSLSAIKIGEEKPCFSSCTNNFKNRREEFNGGQTIVRNFLSDLQKFEREAVSLQKVASELVCRRVFTNSFLQKNHNNQNRSFNEQKITYGHDRWR